MNDTSLPEQNKLFPSTRFMGSKKKLLPSIYKIVSELEYDTAVDAFSGSGVVSYLFKTLGKNVISNDHMHMSSTFAKALIENQNMQLSEIQLALICSISRTN